VIPAQRQALRLIAQPRLTLGPALAWADIKVNRAWLRSGDHQGFPRREVGRLVWDETLAAWAQDLDTAGLLAIEADLRTSNYPTAPSNAMYTPICPDHRGNISKSGIDNAINKKETTRDV
jgi:hypothetical protein